MDNSSIILTSTLTINIPSPAPHHLITPEPPWMIPTRCQEMLRGNFPIKLPDTIPRPVTIPSPTTRTPTFSLEPLRTTHESARSWHLVVLTDLFMCHICQLGLLYATKPTSHQNQKPPLLVLFLPETLCHANTGIKNKPHLHN